MRLRDLLITTAKWASVLSDPLMGKRPGPRLLIYHQVGAGSGLEMDVSPQAFSRQLDWMQSHGRIVHLETALIGRSEPDSGEMYVLTFDDGHVGVFEHAFPTLLSRGLPFTLYLTTDPIERGGTLHDDDRMRLLSWGQIEEMVGSGLVTVGAHSHRHLDMRGQSKEAIRNDLIRCDQLLELRLGMKPRHFAYPWGHWSQTADLLVRERYESAVLGGGRGVSPGDDLHQLHRLPVMASDSYVLFKRKMWGGLRLENALRSLRDSFTGRAE